MYILNYSHATKGKLKLKQNVQKTKSEEKDEKGKITHGNYTLIDQPNRSAGSKLLPGF